MFARATKGKAEFEKCLQIRREVFIEEQGVAEGLELDGLEAECVHFLAWKDGDRELEQAIGTARLWIDATGIAKAQRVAVLETARGDGAGRVLMRAVEEVTRSRGIASLVLGAQLTAIPFYESIGYKAYGNFFDDAGILHRMMRRNLVRGASAVDSGR